MGRPPSIRLQLVWLVLLFAAVVLAKVISDRDATTARAMEFRPAGAFLAGPLPSGEVP